MELHPNHPPNIITPPPTSSSLRRPSDPTLPHSHPNHPSHLSIPLSAEEFHHPSTPTLLPPTSATATTPTTTCSSTRRLSLASSTHVDASEVDIRRRKTRLSATGRSRRINPSILGTTHVDSDDDIITSADADAIIESQLPGGDFDWELTGSDRNNNGNRKDDDDDIDVIMGKNNSRRCQCFRDFHSNLPFGLQCLISIILGDLFILLIFGLPDVAFSNTKYILDPKPVTKWTSNINIGGMPLLLWALYLMITYTLHWLVLYALNVLPTILQRFFVVALGTYYEDRLVEYTNLIRALHQNLTIAAWAIFSNLTWNLFIANDVVVKWEWQTQFCAYLFPGPKECPKNIMWWDYVSVSLLAILFASLIWTGKRLIVVLIVTRFQRAAFSSRIKKTKFADEVLRRLSNSIKHKSSSTPAIHTIPTARILRPDQTVNHRESRPSSWILGTSAIPPSTNTTTTKVNSDAVHLSINDTHIMNDDTNKVVTDRHRSLKEKGLARARKLLARKAQAIAIGVGHVLLDPTALQAATTIPLTQLEAHMLARNLFYSLVRPGADEIQLCDFEPYFASNTDARRAFRLFDKDGNGDISKQELKAILVELMREKQNLEDSMEDTANAVVSLERLFSSIALLLIVLVILSVFKIEVNFASLLTLLVPFSFIFGNTFRDLFEALIFLFVYHSFSVGDRIMFDNEMYIVKSLSVFTTVLQRGDGRIVYYPNSVLCKKPIDNVRQSGGMLEEVELRLAIDTPRTKLYQLEDRMKQFLSEHGRDYVADGFQVHIKQFLIEQKIMVTSVYIAHKSNWQDTGARTERRNRFMHAIRLILEELDIHGPDVTVIFVSTAKAA